MALYLEVSIDGDTVGYKLTDSAEDVAAALKSAARWGGLSEVFMAELRDCMQTADPNVASFLRSIADAIPDRGRP